MRAIELTRGRIALVDDDDFEYLHQFNWCAVKHGKTYYAMRRSSTVDGKRECILMHRVINKTPVGMDTDHIDRNGLNNQKINLRSCTHAENMKNQSECRNTYKYKKDENANCKTQYIGIRSWGKMREELIILSKFRNVNLSKTITDILNTIIPQLLNRIPPDKLIEIKNNMEKKI